MPTPQLRDYQIQGVDAIRAALGRVRRVLYVLSTGGGKTVIFTYIATHAAAKGNRILILAHRAEIADQISLALDAWNVPHGRIQPGYATSADLVQVGMVQTVARRLDRLQEPALLIPDEAHHSVAGTWQTIMARWTRARVLGVTATPERLDGVGLRAAFDAMVEGPPMAWLIEHGYLANYRYLAPANGIDVSGVRRLAGDYNPTELAAVLDQAKIHGDVLDSYRTHLAGQSAIAFTCTVSHAEHVAATFRTAGIPAASIDGAMKPAERRALVDALRDGRLKVLSSCELISEGFDAPAVQGGLLLRPTQSFALHRQQIGRVLRPKPDGSPAIIVDHVKNVYRHGLPDDPHEWSLDSEKRAVAAPTSALRRHRLCQLCQQVFPLLARQAPCEGRSGCLFAPPPVAPARIEELTDPAHWSGLNLKAIRGSQLRRAIWLAGADLSRLAEIQQAKGYKVGWVYYARRAAIARRTLGGSPVRAYPAEQLPIPK